jgi:hypothetical protein
VRRKVFGLLASARGLVVVAVLTVGGTRMSRARYRARTSKVLAVLVAALGTGLFASPAVAAASTPTKTVAFSGHYSGTASLLIDNGSVTISSIKGKGTGTLLGAGSVAGKGSAQASATCNFFGGGGSIKGTDGTITLTVAKSAASQACANSETAPVKVSIKGVAKVTGGSGATKGATGSLKFTGSLNLAGTSGAQNGPFSVVLTGKIKVDG